MSIERFTIHITGGVWQDLRDRIARTRWPDEIPGAGWAYGTDPTHLRDLVGYWAGGFDWPAHERALNRLEHYRFRSDLGPIHFVHARGQGPGSLPIVLTHGWPSSFLEYVDLIPALTDPLAHGGRVEDAFDVIIPSLPGYGFSGAPPVAGIYAPVIADAWVDLMAALGYHRFAAHGTDVGAGVTAAIGRRHPERLVGLHLSGFGLAPPPPPHSAAEEAYLATGAAWDVEEGAYAHLHSTKPQTVAYALNDSPAGLAGWIAEKFRAWSDPSTAPGRDIMLANISIYWATQTINSSMRVYYERAHAGAALPSFVDVPSGFAVFANEAIPFGRPPRSVAERWFRVARWTEFDRGGHFAAWERPDDLVHELREFFRPLR